MDGRSRAAVIAAVLLTSTLSLGAGCGLTSHSQGSATRGHAAAFQRYVERYIAGWRSQGQRGVPQRDRRWAIAHPREVLAEGTQACGWLGRRPSAPDVDPTRAFSVDTLITAYLRDPAVDGIADVAPMSRRTITAGAWSFLCLDVRKDRTAPLPED